MDKYNVLNDRIDLFCYQFRPEISVRRKTKNSSQLLLGDQ